MDKAAIGWSIAIVAAGVAIAFAGQSGQSLGINIEAPEAVVRPGTIETPSYEETKPKTDPFADIAAEVKGQASSQPKQMEQEMKDQEMKQMEEQDMKQTRQQEMKQMEPQTVNVSIPAGTSVPGCEETSECYIPAQVTISTGDTVVWTNDDTAAHTVTSGTPSDGPDGKFDSSLVMGGATFEFTFDESGSYDYFCMVHPWMTGNVMVN